VGPKFAFLPFSPTAVSFELEALQRGFPWDLG